MCAEYLVNIRVTQGVDKARTTSRRQSPTNLSLALRLTVGLMNL